MFNTKRIKALEETFKRFCEDTKPCRGCGCLIDYHNAIRVEDFTGDIVDYLYFCHKCKPNYDEIDNNHIKWKNKKVIVGNKIHC